MGRFFQGVRSVSRKTNTWLIRIVENYSGWGMYDMPFVFYDKREYEERYGEEVGRCNTHKVQIVDRSCDLCADELEQAEDAARCKECEEVRIDEYGDIDARVVGGMKCGVCAYG